MINWSRKCSLLHGRLRSGFPVHRLTGSTAPDRLAACCNIFSNQVLCATARGLRRERRRDS